jgi:hypothetical protein
MIWDFALQAPQLHIMRGEDISRSKVNYVMQACSEARSRGLKLEMPYYQVGKACVRENILSDPYEFLPTSPRFYMNLDVDTFWVGQQDRFFPDCVRYLCSICGHKIGDRSVWDPFYGLQSKVLPKCHHRISLKRLAIQHNMWTDFSDDEVHITMTGRQLDCLNLLRSMNPQELLIVVGSTDCSKDRHARLVPPS